MGKFTIHVMVMCVSVCVKYMIGECVYIIES